MMGSRNKHHNELNSGGAEAGSNDESVSIREGGKGRAWVCVDAEVKER